MNTLLPPETPYMETSGGVLGFYGLNSGPFAPEGGCSVVIGSLLARNLRIAYGARIVLKPILWALVEVHNIS